MSLKKRKSLFSQYQVFPENTDKLDEFGTFPSLHDTGKKDYIPQFTLTTA